MITYSLVIQFRNSREHPDDAANLRRRVVGILNDWAQQLPAHPEQWQVSVRVDGDRYDVSIGNVPTSVTSLALTTLATMAAKAVSPCFTPLLPVPTLRPLVLPA